MALLLPTAAVAADPPPTPPEAPAAETPALPPPPEPASPEVPAEPLPQLPSSGEPLPPPVDVASIPSADKAVDGPAMPRSTLTWDLNLEGALGKRLLDGEGLGGFGRIRGGLLYIDESDLASPSFLSLGLTYDLSDFSPGTFGLQGELMSLSSGLWGQLGVAVDTQPKPAIMGAFGFSLVGAEAQLRWDEDEGRYFALYGKIRIPISVIARALRQP